MGQTLTLKVKGLWTHPSELSEVPDGALLLADNLVIDEESVATPRRGFEKSSTLPNPADRINQFFTYQSKILSHFSTDSIAYDTGAGWSTYAGTFTPIDSVTPVRAVESQQNLYVSTQSGIKKLDKFDGNFEDSGIPKGLTATASFPGGTGSAVDNDKQVAYRVVWGKEDANKNLILGAPSERLVVANTSGLAKNVDLVLTIPDGITINHFFQIYRSSASDTAIDPGEELGLVAEAFPTAAEITAKSLSIQDQTPDGLTGATIYSAPSQEGILQANEQPPRAKDLAEHKGFLFYGNTLSRHRLTFTILAADGGGTPGVALQLDDIITVAGVNYTGKAATTVADEEFAVSTAPTPSQRIDETARALVRVINQTTDNTQVNAFYISGSDDLPGKILIEGRVLGDDEFGASFIPQVANANPFAPTLSKTQSFTTGDVDTGGDILTVTAHGMSDDDRVIISSTGTIPAGIDAEAVYFVISSTTNTFQLSLTEGGSAIDITSTGAGTHYSAKATTVSTNDEFKNGLYFSKLQRPEAVPTTNVLFVGTADKEILRIIPLRDSLFILKEDGIYRLTGETPVNFRVDLFDNTARILSPKSVVNVNNQIFGFSDQGIVAITETGVTVVSRPIESTLIDLLGVDRTKVENLSFGISYETDRKYLFFVIEKSTDTTPTQAFVYNTFTSTWTRWDKPAAAGFVNPVDDLIYLGAAQSDGVLKERKSFTFKDFADEDFDVTITAVNAKVVTLFDVTGIIAGDLLFQDSNTFSVIESIDVSTQTITVVSELPFTTGTRQILPGIDAKMQWVPVTGQNPGISKHFREVSFLFKKGILVKGKAGFSTDISLGVESLDITTIVKSNAWGMYPWGQSPWGGLNQRRSLRTYVPLEKQRAAQLNVEFGSRVAWSDWKLNGLSVIYEPMSERTRRSG